MTITTKDGKIYRTFSEPNPLLSKQEFCDEKKLELHNLKFKSTVTKTPKKVPTIIKKSKSFELTEKDLDQIMEPAKTIVEAPKIKEIVVEIPVIVESPKPIEAPAAVETNYIEVDDKDVLIIHVLPIHIVREKDELYDEIRDIRKYGKKYDIEGIMIDSSDLQIQLLVDSEVKENYILYPSKYKTGKFLDMRRWWQVTKIEKIEDNYLIDAVISNFHPDFSN